MYLKLINGQPEKYSIGALHRDNPNVSFPEKPSDELLAEWDVYPYTRPPVPDYDPLSHRLTGGVFKQVDGEWVLPWVIEKLPLDQAGENVRTTRNGRLQETDWVVIMHTEKGTNIPMDWEVYRQALRDITAQEGFPYSVEWPIKPE